MDLDPNARMAFTLIPFPFFTSYILRIATVQADARNRSAHPSGIAAIRDQNYPSFGTLFRGEWLISYSIL